METFVLPLQIRWADLDPNFHLRHSVFYDWGASCRLNFLIMHGLTMALMQERHFGPVLFREECIFRKEINFGDPLHITMELLKSRKDFSRWSIRHSFIKDIDTVAAILIADSAWMDTLTRKLTVTPGIIHEIFSKMPRGNDFQWTG